MNPDEHLREVVSIMKNTMNARFFKSPGSRMDAMISDAVRVLAPSARRVFWAMRKWAYAAPQSDVARHLHGMEMGDVMGICTLAALQGRAEMYVGAARAHVREAIHGLRVVRKNPGRGIRPMTKTREEWAVERLTRATNRVVGAWAEYRDSLRASMDIAMDVAVKEIRAFAGHGGSISLDSPTDDDESSDGYAWLGHAPTREREVALVVDLERLGVRVSDADIEEGRVSSDVHDALARDIGLARDVYARLGGRHTYTRDSVLRGALRRAARR